MNSLLFPLMGILIMVIVGARNLDFQTHQRIKYLCLQPVNYGKCRVAVNAWYYNHVERECKRFLYRLCEGNRNRFYTKNECDEMCNRPWVIVQDTEYDGLL